MNQPINLPLTLQEAHAVLRALATAADSDDTAREDRAPIDWAAQRLRHLIEDARTT